MIINVQMRIVIEGNIDQIENMCFTDNVMTLSGVKDLQKGSRSCRS